ncbi:MAG: family 16 glycoside hydrolase [Gemmataceae bacterium]
MIPCILGCVVLTAPATVQQTPAPQALFNGKDLRGWQNVNCAPNTFFVKDDAIITTGRPTGYMRSDRHYENFILEFDWMHVREKGMANSGLFVWGDALPAVGSGYTRSIEVQVLINYEPADGWATSHGDLFSIWGAKCKPDRPHHKGLERCLPSERRVKGAGQWNHYKVVANNGVLKLEVNGKEVSGVSESSPRKGYLALESEGSECHFKNLMLTELPSTNPKPAEVATIHEGHQSLLDGLTLAGWSTDPKSWKAGDGNITATPEGTTPITSTTRYSAAELVFDWKVNGKEPGPVKAKLGTIEWEFTPGAESSYVARWTNDNVATEETTKLNIKPGDWHRTILRNLDDQLVILVDGVERSRHKIEKQPGGPVVFAPVAGLEIRNVFIREAK